MNDAIKGLKNIRRKLRAEITRERKFQASGPSPFSLEKSHGMMAGYMLAEREVDDLIKKLEAQERGPGEVEVGPGEWAIPPVEGAKPIYASVVGDIFIGRYPTSSARPEVLERLRWTWWELESRVKRWRDGERWM